MDDLSSLGAHFEMRTFIEGKVTPPPKPSRNLNVKYLLFSKVLLFPYFTHALTNLIAMRYSNPICEHTGLSRVAMMLSSTAAKKPHLPPKTSAIRPPGT